MTDDLHAQRDLSNVSLKLVLTSDEVMQFKKWLGERRPGGVLAFDLETSGLDAYTPTSRIRLAQVGDGETGWAFPWDLWRGMFLEALSTYEGPLVGHNVGYDIKWLERFSDWRAPWSRMNDTMIAARIYDPTASAGLKPLSDKYINRKASHGQKLLDLAFIEHGWTWDTIPLTFEPYWSYASLDTVITARLYDMFAPRINSGGPDHDAYDLEMATLRITTRMEQRGARVDLDYAREQFQKCYDYAERIQRWAASVFKVNIGSPGALGRWFQENGGTITVFTPTGKPKVDKYQLKLFADPENGYNESVRMLAEQVLLFRKYGKLASSYFEKITEVAESTPDGSIVHASINPLGARTSRMSISNPPLQQLPRGDSVVRNMFIARDGNLLISTDFSQIEMRMLAHFSGDHELQTAFRIADDTDGDFFVEIGKEIYSDPEFQKSDKRRGLIKNCVPLSSQILTQRGWLSYDEVKVGDETLGYDLETDTMRWTDVRGVHVYNDPDDLADLYCLSHSNRKFYCTDNHRWAVQQRVRVGRNGPTVWQPGIARAYEIAGSETRLILAAQAESGSLDVSPSEAALLGWVLGDGVLQRSELSGRTSQGLDGRRRGCRMMITQKKKHEIKIISTLLDSLRAPYRVSVDKRGEHFFSVDPDYARDLLSRARIEGDKSDLDPWALALGLTHEARAAMADALNSADGSNHQNGGTQIRITEASDTPVSQLCVALYFLLGHYVRIRREEPTGRGWQRTAIDRIYPQKRYFTGQRATLEYVSPAPVWCVTTGLGTWTMRQEHDKTPVLTGNTMYGMAYGAGPAKMAESAGVPVDRMRGVVTSLTARYPGIKDFMRKVEDVGKRREMESGRGWVNGVDGRRLPCDTDKVYTLVNYLIQGGAAVAFKRALLRLDDAGYGDWFLIPVHDEILVDIPEDLVPAALTDIPKIMQDDTMAVPIPADSEGGFSRWGEKYL